MHTETAVLDSLNASAFAWSDASAFEQPAQPAEHAACSPELLGRAWVVQHDVESVSADIEDAWNALRAS